MPTQSERYKASFEANFRNTFYRRLNRYQDNMKPILKNMEPLFDTFQINDRIGSGGFGTVYKARHIQLPDKISAIKIIISPNNYGLDQICQALGDKNKVLEEVNNITQKQTDEVKRLYRFSDSLNIVKIENYKYENKIYEKNGDYETDEIFGFIIILMEYLVPLDIFFRRDTVETPVIMLGYDICNALEVVHSEGLVHRDIKPQNILLSANGYFKITDFGLSRSTDTSFELTTNVGTMSYFAPEIQRSDYDSKVDMYSLGLVLYEYLNGGSLPFEIEFKYRKKKKLPSIQYNDRLTASIRRMQGEQFPPPKYGGDKLKKIIMKALSHHPDDRFTHITEFKNELSALSSQNDFMEMRNKHKDIWKLYASRY